MHGNFLNPVLIIAGTLAWILTATSASCTQVTPYPTARNYDDAAIVPPEHPVDMLHMRLTVSFVPTEGLVKGTVTHIFRPLRERVDSLFFNGPGIHVARALLNGQTVRYDTSSTGITIYPASPLRWNTLDSVTISYEATPRRGIYFIGWNDTTGRRRRQIWTQGQGIDNRNWFPCYDEQNDKLTTETIITFDAKYRVLSNGRLVSERQNSDGTATWHYAMDHPHASYLVMLGIGDYGVKTVHTKAGVPVHLYYYPDQEDRVASTYQYAAECVDFVAEQTGVPYPWPSYANIPVEDFLYGAMENTTATVFGDFLFVDRRAALDRNYIGTDVHELTHQWFGDYVTSRSSALAWLHESFATFYPKLFFRQIAGEDEYEWIRHQEQDEALLASQQNRLPLTHSGAGRGRVYQKGSVVLDMMMHVFGKEAFRRVIHHYLAHHPFGLVESNDLYQSFQDTLGLSPAWFFNEWIYRGGEPHYDVRYREVQTEGTKGRQTEVTVRQVHPRDEMVGLFRMPIDVEVHYMDGTVDRKTALIAAEQERVIVPNPRGKTVAYLLFDPGGVILKQVTFPRSLQELGRQALGASHMIDRFDAVKALRAFPHDQKRKLLGDIYNAETFYGIRAEVIAQMANDDAPEARAILRQALRDPRAEVRIAIIDSIRTIPLVLRKPFEMLLRDSSYAIVTKALARLAEAFPDGVPEYLSLTKDDIGVGQQVRVAWHQVNAMRGDSSSFRTLAAMVGPTYEFRTRVNAMDALRHLNYLDQAAITGLFDALVHSNARLRGPAVALAEYFLQQGRYRSMLRAYYASRAWKSWETAMLEQVTSLR